MVANPQAARQFAIEVVERLRESGYEAYWAGGCVRDELLGRAPKDFDVATNAAPDQVREVFGYKRTLPIGAAFGVITVRGPRAAGQIEVATFREDAGYSDGRRPDSVCFSTAEQDALRRDFTMNGLFFDPLTNRVRDFVGGRQDLHDGVVRAIGDPYARIAEDKLRMLRAIRFAAVFGFAIEEDTWQAVQREAKLIHKVSAERIASELRRMLLHENRAKAVVLLRDSGLLREILPESREILAPDYDDQGDEPSPWTTTLAILDALVEPTMAVNLAALLWEVTGRGQQARMALKICKRWRLSNEETDGCLLLLQHAATIVAACNTPWPQVQRLLIHPRATELVDFAAAAAHVIEGDESGVEFCREKLQLPAEELNPPPLLTGNDLKKAGVPTGPYYKSLLDAVRDAQLEGRVTTVEEAAAWAHSILARK